MLILDLLGVSFHAVVVFGLGKNLLFKSILGHCVLRQKKIKLLQLSWCLSREGWDLHKFDKLRLNRQVLTSNLKVHIFQINCIGLTLFPTGFFM